MYQHEPIFKEQRRSNDALSTKNTRVAQRLRMASRLFFLFCFLILIYLVNHLTIINNYTHLVLRGNAYTPVFKQLSIQPITWQQCNVKTLQAQSKRFGQCSCQTRMVQNVMFWGYRLVIFRDFYHHSHLAYSKPKSIQQVVFLQMETSHWWERSEKLAEILLSRRASQSTQHDQHWSRHSFNAPHRVSLSLVNEHSWEAAWPHTACENSPCCTGVVWGGLLVHLALHSHQ